MDEAAEVEVVTKRKPQVMFYSIAVIAIVAALVVRMRMPEPEDTSNYKPIWNAPIGWQEMPHGPQSIFEYHQVDSKAVIRGSVNQVVADYNPTPGQTAATLVDNYIAGTVEGMPGWTGEEMGTVEGDGTDFHLMRRGTAGKTVITAIHVQGNTTLIIALSAVGENAKTIDSFYPDFEQFLKAISMEKTVIE